MFDALGFVAEKRERGYPDSRVRLMASVRPMVERRAIEKLLPEETEMAKEKQVHVEMEDHFLRCDLTGEALSEKVVELTGALDRQASLEDEDKAIKTDLKAKKDMAAADVSRLNNIVRNRYENKYIACEVTLDFDKRKIVIVRKDTGEIVEDRDMKEGERERQAALFPKEDAA